MALAKILPGTGRGTLRRMVEGAHLSASSTVAPTTTPLRLAVALPVPGRNWRD
jgi:hypothetical protein